MRRALFGPPGGMFSYERGTPVTLNPKTENRKPNSCDRDYSEILPQKRWIFNPNPETQTLKSHTPSTVGQMRRIRQSRSYFWLLLSGESPFNKLVCSLFASSASAPSTLNPQPSTLNSQPSTTNPQPSTLNSQPSTLNPHL